MARVQVDYQGNVTLLTQSIYMSKCTMDVTYYPFDVQMCELKFASWSTEVSRVKKYKLIMILDRKICLDKHQYRNNRQEEAAGSVLP